MGQPAKKSPASPQKERSEVADLIELMGAGLGDPDTIRELIALYGECEWRATKLQIIRVLSQNPTGRTLEFLFRLAQEPKDLPIAEAAVWSLGQTRHPLAARFLVRFYDQAEEFLKPAIVGALGQIPDRTLASDFVEELQGALLTQQTALIKNLVLTLGELKVHEALPLLLKIASDRSQPSIGLAALVAIGKISRNPKDVDGLEKHFRDDLFEYQLYSSVKTQVQFRSQWRLEDYLSRIFEGETFHRSLPFELSYFKEDDVREGLKLFSQEASHFARLCQALARIDFQGIENWYAELIDFARLKDKDLELVLESLSSHQGPHTRAPLKKLLPQTATSHTALRKWVEAVALSLPDAELELKEIFSSDRFSSLPDPERIAMINLLVDYGLTVQTQGEKLQNTVRILEGVLEADPSPSVQSRTLRGIAHLGMASKKASQFAKEKLATPEYSASCLKALELMPDRSALTPLLALLKKIPSGSTVALLRALTAQPELPQSSSELDDWIASLLREKSEIIPRVEAIRLLAHHPRKVLIPALMDCLASGAPRGHEAERVALAAVIALKSHVSWIGDDAAETLGKLLRSAQASLSGRALDTLTSMTSLRSKRVAIDFLRENADNTDVCDKIIRCLEAPEAGAEYFTAVVDDILKRYPQHPRLDGLVSFREKLSSATAASGSRAAAVKGADIAALDRALAERITDYESLDETAKAALRSAELPFLHPEMFDEYVDKSASLVEYCKAVDIQLEKVLGRKHLFPKFENQLHEFQSALHTAGLGDEFPSVDRVLSQMELGKHFNAQSLPLHKMITLAQAIRNGRIVNERFKTLDGLRAWAVILLLFARKFGGSRPLLPVRSLNDEQITHFCRRLIALQEIRNPAAHRQTVVQFKTIDSTRAEALSILNLIQKGF